MNGSGMFVACCLSLPPVVNNKCRGGIRQGDMGRRVEGVVRVQFARRVLEGQLVVDDQVIAVEHKMLSVRSARLFGEPADAVAKIPLTELAFESDERALERN